MQNQQNESEWSKPKPERPMDEMDKAVLALGEVHGRAMRGSVGIPTFIYRLLREDYLAAQEINRSLSPKERATALRLLTNRNPDESVLDLLKVVIAQRP